MNLREFLSALLPESGVYFAAGLPTGGTMVQYPSETVEGLAGKIEQLNMTGVTSYFALASFNKLQGKQKRTQDNARLVRSLFLDLDVEPGNPTKYQDQRTAAADVVRFCGETGMPAPMLVDSGRGVHVYWPLAHSVTVVVWQAAAVALKGACIAHGLKADPVVTADAARILRPLGSLNVKSGKITTLKHAAGPYDLQRLLGCLAQPPVSLGPPAASSFAAGSGLGDNLGATNNPGNFDRIAYMCRQVRDQVGTGGAHATEPQWRAMLGIVKFCEEQTEPIRQVGHKHPGFSASESTAKLNAWNAGPTTCAHLRQFNPTACDSCRHWQKITSPIQLGRTEPVGAIAAPTTIQKNNIALTASSESTPATVIPELPEGYRWREDGAVLMLEEDAHGVPRTHVVTPYMLYPIGIAASEIGGSFSVWHLRDHVGDRVYKVKEFNVPVSIMSSQTDLSKLLGDKGIVLSDAQWKWTKVFMTAYLKKLKDDTGTGELVTHYGWNKDFTGFVLGDKVYSKSGEKAVTTLLGLRDSVKQGLHSKGSVDGWKRAMDFYLGAGNEGARMFVYASFASILFHMNGAGQKAAALCASGESGRGKTTALMAASSVWGEPNALVVNGNVMGATTNALYSAIGKVHSLPFLLDDTTERDSNDMRQFYLNLPQGEGKRRLNADGSAKGNTDTWSNLTLTTTNVDTLSALSTADKDAAPHLRRLVAVYFAPVDTSPAAKARAQQFLYTLEDNHGVAGEKFLKAIIKDYEVVKQIYRRNLENTEQRIGSADASGERYWSAVIAACYTAGQIVRMLKILDWPIEADLTWMLTKLSDQRAMINGSAVTPLSALTEFLDSHLRETLVISSTHASNLNNIAKDPQGELLIRRENDTHTVYISQSAIAKYLASRNLNTNNVRRALQQSGVLQATSIKRTLGAGTIYANGQIHTWVIDSKTLDVQTALSAPPATASAPANVVSITAARSAA